MTPLFEKRMQAAGLDKRVTFVEGDAQKLPFVDDYADVIVSRGMLIFVPDIAKCLREVERVLKPTGVAFLGGRYLYAPQENKISTDKLKEIVNTANVPGVQVIDWRGQWVKILGPQAPAAARESQLGPQMLAHRVVADYRVTEGACLLLCRSDGGLEQALQQGLLDVTQLQLTALYPSEGLARAAEAKLRAANLADRMTCVVGDVHALPFAEASFHVVVGVGGVPFWKDRATAFREIHRVLRPDGVGLVGGMYRHMPDARKVSTASLRETAAATKLPSIRVLDDMGQWVEIRKGRDERATQTHP
jgi:ubiquinone/menaquinone biosynthesis C-methylase UbiE